MNELLLAQAAGGQSPSPFGPVLIMGLIFAFFYFLVMRPQQRKEREKEAFRAGLKKNDEVITSGGFHGRVVDLKGSVVLLELAQNVRVRIERRSVEAPASPPAKAESREQSS